MQEKILPKSHNLDQKYDLYQTRKSPPNEWSANIWSAGVTKSEEKENEVNELCEEGGKEL